MTTTLPNGTRVPDVASTSWAGDLEVNWQLLDAAIGAIGSNVQTNRPNTWTAEQTFSEPIIGNLTGTASKAGADEDGTSIKTGYVNVAGTQTVTGQKTWTDTNTFSKTNSDTIQLKNGRVAIGETISSDAYTQLVFKDKNTDNLAYIRDTYVADGATTLDFFVRNKYTNGSPSTTGSVVYTFFGLTLDNTGKSYARLKGDFYPYTNNTYSLGSSSYQWSSVYAQTYYYNGTAWGLDKANTWTGNNTFTSTITTKTNVDRTVAPASDTTYGTIICRDKNGSAMFRMQGTIKTDLSNVWDMMMVAPNASYITFFKYTISGSSSDRELRLKVTSVVPDDNSTADLGTSTNQWKSVYAQSYFYNGTAWGLDKANTWTAQQKYTGANTRGILSIYNSSYTKGSAISVTDLSIGTIFLGDGGNTGLGNSLGFISCDLASTGNKSMLSLSAIKNEASSTERANLILEYDKSDTTSPEKIRCKGTVFPNSDSTYNLGTSTNKWKTLNGINPGALRMPDASNSVNVDTTGWVTDGSAWNTITSSNLIDGYLYINYSRCSADDYILVRLRTSSHHNPTFCVQANTTSAGNHFLYVCVPVSKLFDVFLEIKTTGTLQKACIFPCLGNV